MTISIMELATFLFVVILLRLIARNICSFLSSIFIRYELYGQVLETKELNTPNTDENRDFLKESQKLYEILSKEPSDNDLSKPTTAFTIDSYSTKDNTFSFLQDASSEISCLPQAPMGQLHGVSLLLDSYEPEQKPNVDTKNRCSSSFTTASYPTETITVSFLQDSPSETADVQEPMSQLHGMNPSPVASRSEPIHSCSTETNAVYLLQDASSETSGLQEPMSQLHGVSLLPGSYAPEEKTNLDKKDKPSTPFTTASYPTEAITVSFLHDSPSETADVQEPLNQLYVVNPSPVTSGSEPIPSCSTVTNSVYLLQDASSETSGLQEPMSQLHGVSLLPGSYASEQKTKLDKKDARFSSFPTEAITVSFLQDASSETAHVQEPMSQLHGMNPLPVASRSEPIHSCSTETNAVYLLQDASSETSVLQEPMSQLHGVSLLPGSYAPEEKTNLDKKDKPSTPFTTASYPTEAITISLLQDTSLETSGLQEPMSQLLGVRLLSGNFGSELIARCSTEPSTDSFQDLSSDISEDFDRPLLKLETSMDLITRETSKRFEIPGNVTRLSEGDLQNHSVMEILNDILSICQKTDKESNSESEQFVQFVLKELNTNENLTPDYSCEITLETSDHDDLNELNSKENLIPDYSREIILEASDHDSSSPEFHGNSMALLAFALNHKKPFIQLTEVQAVDTLEASDIDKKLSIEEESQNVCSKNMIPVNIDEGTSYEEVTADIIKEIELDEIYQSEQCSLDRVPIEFIYPCLPKL